MQIKFYRYTSKGIPSMAWSSLKPWIGLGWGSKIMYSSVFYRYIIEVISLVSRWEWNFKVLLDYFRILLDFRINSIQDALKETRVKRDSNRYEWILLCLNMIEYDWIWLNMTEYDWIWLNMTEYELIGLWLNMKEYDWIWMNMTEYDWIRLNKNEYDWIWMNMI